ncbi:MAG: hypothetical protein J0H98_06425 [Solirubrobacterales bacterium]|nr:hypothetical protein [Solirubrobacterales bacterium]
MKRLMLGFTMAVLGVALFAPAAEAAPTLTMHEAKMAVMQGGYGGTYYGGIARKCSRLASNRIRCSVVFTTEMGLKLRTCRSRVEVVENAEIKVRTLRKACRDRKAPYLTWERASRAAAKAMDPMATHPNYEMGFGGGSIGKNKYIFQAVWVTERDQTCLQTANVRLVKKKIRVTVSEIACVDEPEWP